MHSEIVAQSKETGLKKDKSSENIMNILALEVSAVCSAPGTEQSIRKELYCPTELPDIPTFSEL